MGDQFFTAMKKIILSIAIVSTANPFASNDLTNTNKIVVVEKPMDVLDSELDILHDETNTLLAIFRCCKITHNVKDEEGNTMRTAVYYAETS